MTQSKIDAKTLITRPFIDQNSTRSYSWLSKISVHRLFFNPLDGNLESTRYVTPASRQIPPKTYIKNHYSNLYKVSAPASYER